MLVMVFILILPLAINIIYIIIVIYPLICSLRNHMNEPKYVRYVMCSVVSASTERGQRGVGGEEERSGQPRTSVRLSLRYHLSD